MSGEVKNWLPGGGEPGKYVTILDLKEQWMRTKEQEKDEEEENRRRKLKEVEKEERKKVFERLDELKIGCEEEDWVEAKLVGVGNSRLRSGDKGRVGRSEWSEIGGSSSRTEKRKGGDSGGELVRVSETDKSAYKKKGLEVDDVRAYGDNVKVRSSGRGRYRSGKRFSGDGRHVKGSVSDVTASDGVDVDVVKGEEGDSVGIEKGTITNCPCHSKSENQGGGGFWVCKYVEPTPRDEIGQSKTGSEALKGDMAANVRTENCRMEEVKLKKKKHKLPRQVREEMIVEWGKDDAMRVNGDFPSVVNHDDGTRRTWQPREKRKMAKGRKDELIAKQMKKEEMDVDKDSRRMIIHDGYCQKNDMELQSQTVEPSVEIEEHSKASLVNEREMIRRGKFRDKDCLVDRRKIYDTGMFKAEKNFGSLPMDYVKKDTTHVNSSSKKLINQNGSQLVINGSTLKLENSEPVDCPEKSDAALRTKMVENSSIRFRDTRNGIYPRKPFVNKRLQTERIVTNERLTNSGKVYGQRERRMDREGLMWVRKGDASVGDAESSK